MDNRNKNIAAALGLSILAGVSLVIAKIKKEPKVEVLDLLEDFYGDENLFNSDFKNEPIVIKSEEENEFSEYDCGTRAITKNLESLRKNAQDAANANVDNLSQVDSEDSGLKTNEEFKEFAKIREISTLGGIKEVLNSESKDPIKTAFDKFKRVYSGQEQKEEFFNLTAKIEQAKLKWFSRPLIISNYSPKKVRGGLNLTPTFIEYFESLAKADFRYVKPVNEIMDIAAKKDLELHILNLPWSSALNENDSNETEDFEIIMENCPQVD